MIKKILLLNLTVASLLSAGEIQPKQLPHDSEWYVHLNVERLAAGGIGQGLSSFVESTFNEHYQRAKGFYFLLTPVLELKGITVFGDGALRGGSVLINAKLNRSLIVDILESAEEYSEEQKAGVTVHSWKVGKQTFHAAFHGEEHLLVGKDAALFHAALSTLTGQAKGMDAAAEGGGGALVQGRANIEAMKLPSDVSTFTEAVKLLAFSVAENGGLLSATARLNASDPQEAQDLKVELDGIIGLSLVADVDMKLESRVDGKTVIISASIPLSGSR